MRIGRIAKVLWVLAPFASLFCVPANAAPPKALDKTVTVSSTSFTPALCSNGRHNHTSRVSTQRIYISTKGRLFVELDARAGSYSRKRLKSSSETSFHFSGNKLVGTAVSVSGARREVISFDPTFHSCTAQMIFGEEPGKPYTWTNLAGVRCTGTGKPEVLNISCSIADGNVFAR